MAIDLNTPKAKFAVWGFFLALCLVIFIISIAMLQRAIASKHWPATSGTITRSDITWNMGSKGNADKYTPDIKFTYTVGGKEYHSSSYRIYNSSSTIKADIQEIINRYPVNSEVQVYYSPRHPSHAVLVPGTTRGIYTLFLGSGAFVAILVAVFFLLIRSVKTGKPLNETVRLDSSDPEKFRDELMNNELVKKHFEEMYRKMDNGK